ncbi:hypothetical protein ACJIZ3_010963 [Penstemon smallii]|uniref:NAD-dependent epimerase/dehydratase domain-containing protein n=1 Tax=Penstemon smallii TaxID=265156 RepID=A0ABD3UHS6_9LAMI
MVKGNCKVCVTGGAGYIGSSLVKKLLNEGYTVHATLRNLNDQTKVDILKSFPGAEQRLKLFEADMYKAEEYEPAIQGCEFVFHVATPMLHTEGHKHKNMIDATLDGARIIASTCIRSKTVRRLIYTASVMSSSPLKEDGSGNFKDFMDETCWTPLNHPTIDYNHNFLKEYIKAKTLSEKELLSFNNNDVGVGMEVVTLVCGLVGGECLMPYTPGSVTGILSQLLNDEYSHDSLKFMEGLLGKVPIVHIEDVSNALIFCMEAISMSGRFLCTNAYVSNADIASYCQNKYPQYSIKKYLEGPKGETKLGPSLLNEKGFKYEFDWHLVLDDCINNYINKNGDLKL